MAENKKSKDSAPDETKAAAGNGSGTVRFQSRYPNLRVNLVSNTYKWGPNGSHIPDKKGVSVQFANSMFATSNGTIIGLLRAHAEKSNDVFEMKADKLQEAAAAATTDA